MSSIQRVALLALAVAVAVAAFVLLRPDQERSDRPAAPRASSAPAKSTATPATVRPNRPRPSLTLLTPAKVTKLSVTKGDTVRFAVRSPSADEIHVHGYDLSKQAPANQTVRMSFPATIEGIFEIELENSGTPLAKLEVQP